MKRMLCVAGLMAAMVQMATAQEAGTPPSPRVDAGAGFMVAGANDHFDTGGGAFVYVGGRAAPVLGLRGTMSVWGSDTDSSVLSPSSFTVFSTEGSLLLHVDVEPALHAWVGGGIGVYWFDDSHDDRDDGPYWYDRPPLDTIEDDFGGHVLVGADVLISGPVSLFVEGKYIFIETEATVRRVSADGRTFTESHEDVNLDTGFVSFGIRIAL